MKWNFIKRKSITLPPKKNNRWHHRNAESDTVFIFVHGFMSNSETCWTSDKNTFWPDLVKKDQRLCNPSIYLAGYHTAFDSGEYKIEDCTAEVLCALQLNDIDGYASPISASKIIFVCHSLGGIIVRNILERHSEIFELKSVGLILMASPSVGSEYANYLSCAIHLLRNKLGKQLLPFNNSIIDIDRRFKQFKDNNKLSLLCGAEAIEDRPLLKYGHLIGVPPIVTFESAARYFGTFQRIAKSNHSTIVKPCDHDHDSHSFLCNFYQKYFSQLNAISSKKTSPTTTQINEEKSSSSLASKILFDIYSNDSSPYYLSRAIDESLEKIVDLKSIWLSGPSGCGKTSALRHLIHRKDCKPIEICLALCNENFSKDGIIKEIGLTVQQKLEVIFDATSVSETAKAIASYSIESPIVLYIDEVPILGTSDQQIEDFVSLVANLLNSIKHISKKENIRFLISSIQTPTFTSSKFNEQMTLLSTDYWSEEETKALVKFLYVQLKLDASASTDIADIAIASKGSPRSVKRILREKIIDPSADTQLLIEKICCSQTGY